jgi:hypothetical protein
MTVSNGSIRNLKPGVWAPIPTFMDENEALGGFLHTRPSLTRRPRHV